MIMIMVEHVPFMKAIQLILL